MHHGLKQIIVDPHPLIEAVAYITKPTPRVITVDKHEAYPKAEAFLKAAVILPASVELTGASNT